MIRPFNSFDEFKDSYKKKEDLFMILHQTKFVCKKKHWWSIKKEITETIPFYELVPIKVIGLCNGIKQVDVKSVIDGFCYRIDATSLYHY